MIDSTDGKIIRALTLDARLSNVQLAHRLDIAVSTVARRIDALLKENIITIKALPNPFKMGYKASAVIGLDVDLKKVDAVCSALSRNGQITLIVTTFGRFDALIIADYTNFELLNHFIKHELLQIEGISAADPYFVSETTKRYSGMFQNNTLESGKSDIVIDETDLKLFAELGNNGRIAYSKLAHDLGISIATVSRRISYLVKQDIIKITAVPNPAKLGYLAIGCIVLHTDFTKIDKIASILAERVEVHLVMKLINSFDIFFIVHFPNPEELYQYLKNKVAMIDGVLNMETFVISEIIKLSTTATGLKLE